MGKCPLFFVAEFLKLSESKQYTASLLVESGDKKHGGWKSTTVTEGYVDLSIAYRNAIAEKILPTSNNLSDFGTSSSNIVPVSTSYDGNGVSSSSNVLRRSLTSHVAIVLVVRLILMFISNDC